MLFFALRGTLRAVPADGVSRRSEGVEPESKLAVRFPRARGRRDPSGRVMDLDRRDASKTYPSVIPVVSPSYPDIELVITH